MNKRYLWTLLIVLALVILRIPALLHPILDVDEAIYGLFARIWFDGGIPYVNCVETKPLGIYLFFGSIFSIFGKWNMIAVHAVTIIIVGITSCVLYKISALLYSKEAGYWAALLYIVFSVTYIPKVLATTIEPIMLLPVCLQFYYWLKYESNENLSSAFLSGIFFAAACCFKYQAGMNLFILLAYLLFIRHRIPLKAAGLFFCGAIIPPAVMFIYIYIAGALNGFIYWNIIGNANYISQGSESLHLVNRIVTRVIPYVASTALLWSLSFTAIFKKIRSLAARSQHKHAYNLRPTQNDESEWLIILWFILSFVPVSTGYRFYGHYFLLLLPSMAILSSRIAVSAFERLWPRRLIIFWMLLPAIGFTVARFYISDIHKVVKEDNLDDYKPIASYVASRTNPEDKILAWGYVPAIYWYSHRLPAIRFFWSDVITGRVPGLKDELIDSDKFINHDAWKMFWEDIKKNRPVYIIDTAPSGLHNYKNYPISRYPELMKYVNNNYKEEAQLNGTIFYRRID
ncbi:MAG: hypothetical protein COV46_01585 [Deltaproteobacteria bacterium CG11_big_fil_rev_8_21_14_0_20_49_13]|nr:MAG: hypothetical protein COV46_01585 [Deltaproteobacteria bacterium CG11_big_fil_rev_8_21_14_0_20_49_13]